MSAKKTGSHSSPEPGRSKHAAQRENPGTRRFFRDEPIPAVGKAAVPVVLIVLCGFVLYGSSVYLADSSGGFNNQVYQPYASLKQVESAHPLDPAGKLLAEGRVVYGVYCVACHMASGTGGPLFPPLAGSEWVIGGGPNRMIRIVLHGLTGPISVKGQEFNAQMLPWGTTLDDKQVAAVVSFVRGNKDWGHNAPPVTPEQVAKVRQAEAARDTFWTAEELLRIPDSD